MKILNSEELRDINGAGFADAWNTFADGVAAVGEALDEALNEIGHAIYHLTRDDDSENGGG